LGLKSEPMEREKRKKWLGTKSGGMERNHDGFNSWKLMVPRIRFPFSNQFPQSFRIFTTYDFTLCDLTDWTSIPSLYRTGNFRNFGQYRWVGKVRVSLCKDNALSAQFWFTWLRCPLSIRNARS
jgi:hypothetical protein